MEDANLQKDTHQLSPEWEAEIDQRISEYREGKADLIDGFVAEQELIEKYNLKISA